MAIFTLDIKQKKFTERLFEAWKIRRKVNPCLLPRGYTDCVKSCTSAEAIYKEGPQKENGFILACKYGHKDIVEYILEKDYFKHLLNGIEDIENKTGFYWACANGHVQIVEVLLNERSGRIDYNVVGREGMTGYLVS